MPGRGRWGEIAHSWRVSVAQAIAPRSTRIIPVDAPSPPPQHTPKPLSISPPPQSSAHRRHYEIRTKVSNRYPLTTFSAVLNPKGLRGSQAALILSLNHRTRLLRVGSVYLEVPAQFTPLTEAWIQWFALWFWRERFKDGTVTFGSGNALAVAILEGSWPRPGHNIRRKIPPAVASAIHTATCEVAASHNIVLQHKVVPHAENNLAYHLSRCDTPELRASALTEEQREQVEESEKMLESMGMELLGDPVPGGPDTVPSVVPKHQASNFSVFSITRLLPVHTFRRIASSVANFRADIRDWRIAAARALSNDPNLVPRGQPRSNPSSPLKSKAISHHSAPYTRASGGRSQSKWRARNEAASRSHPWQERAPPPYHAASPSRQSLSPLQSSEPYPIAQTTRETPAKSGKGRTLSRRRAQVASQRVGPKPGFGLRSPSAPRRLTRPPKSAPLIPNLPIPPRPKIPITSGARDISPPRSRSSNPPLSPDVPPLSSTVTVLSPPAQMASEYMPPIELSPTPIAAPELTHPILPSDTDRPQHQIRTHVYRQGEYTTLSGVLYSCSTIKTIIDSYTFTLDHGPDVSDIAAPILSAFATLVGVALWGQAIRGGDVQCWTVNDRMLPVVLSQPTDAGGIDEEVGAALRVLARHLDIQYEFRITDSTHIGTCRSLTRAHKAARTTDSSRERLKASLQRISQMELRGYVGMFVPEKPAAKALNDDEVSAPERTQSSAADMSENVRILLRTWGGVLNTSEAATLTGSISESYTATQGVDTIPLDTVGPLQLSNNSSPFTLTTPAPAPLPFRNSVEWIENEDDLIESTPPAQQPSLVIPSQSLIEAYEIDPFSPANAPPPRVIRTENEIRTHVYRQGSFTTFAGVLYLRGTDLAADSFVFTLDHNSAPLRVGSSTFSPPYHTTTLSAYAMLFATTFWKNRVAGDLLTCSTVNERARIIAKGQWVESRGVNAAIGQAIRDLSQGYGIEFQFDDILAKDVGLARMVTRCHSLIGRRRLTDRIQLQLDASDKRIIAMKLEGYVDRFEEIPFVAPDPNQEFPFDLPPVFPPLPRPTPQAYVSAREPETFYT